MSNYNEVMDQVAKHPNHEAAIDAASYIPLREIPPEFREDMTKQVGGNHYAKMAIQPMEFVRANTNLSEYLAIVRFNVQRYVWRDKGNMIEDFRKAIDYLEMGILRIQQEEGKRDYETVHRSKNYQCQAHEPQRV